MKPTTKSSVEIIRPVLRRTDILRIGAYCRVSSKSDDQLHSYAAQIDYYTKLAGANPDWELVDVYADKGLTGTEMERRDDLNRMLADCKKGKLDKILIKSFSRLARNTVDSLTIIRDLKLMGVSVRSERERLDTENMPSEMLVMLWSNMAQEESNSISQNMRWSYMKRMRAGEFITTHAPYGYTIVGGKMLEPIETDAQIVRRIFNDYLCGVSSERIADALNGEGIASPELSPIWLPKTIRYILTNEKYVGDTLAQKTFNTETFPHRNIRNKGMKDQYYVKNSHPAIISRDIFEKAQALMASRRPARDRGTKAYPLSGKLVCGVCGTTFKRRQSKSGYVAWVCQRHDRDKSECEMPRIAELDVYAAFTRMARKLKQHAGIILEPALKQLCDLQEALQRDHTGIVDIRQELVNTMEQAHTLSRLRRQNLLDDATWQTHHNEVSARQYELRRKLRILLDNGNVNETIDALDQLILSIKRGTTDGDGFSAGLFAGIVQKAVIGTEGIIRFVLLGGIEITERLDRSNIQ